MEETRRKKIEQIVRDCVGTTLATVGQGDGLITGKLHEMNTALQSLIAVTVTRLEDEYR